MTGESVVAQLRREHGAALRGRAVEPGTVVDLAHAGFAEDRRRPPSTPRRRIVPAAHFAAVEEPGADPILGEPGNVVIPEGGDTMGFGGAGTTKTTLLSLDLSLHLAAGDDWLGIAVPRPVRVALIEAEGPRPLFRRKLRGKLDAWHGGDLGGRLHVLEDQWAEFRFDRDLDLADELAGLEVEVLIVGPVSAIGMIGNGTLGEARAFMAGVARFRERTGRPLAVVLIHHDNRAGLVSGAFEGVVDTLLRTEVHAAGKTVLHFEKVRWAPKWHRRRLDLRWTEGEGFEVAEGRGDDSDLLDRIVS